MKVPYRVCLLILTAAYLGAIYPAGRDAHVCVCRSHGSDCPCCIASVSGDARADRCPVNQSHIQCACGAEPSPDVKAPKLSPKSSLKSSLKPSPKLSLKLSGLCRCREAKKNGEAPSVATMTLPETAVSPDGESAALRPNEGLILPGYKTPPMKPPPV